MKIYTKIFTESEILTIKEALLEYKHFLKNCNPSSSIAIENKKNTEFLLSDFKNTIK